MSTADVIEHLSRERIEPFVLRAGNDDMGLNLYHWDGLAGAAFHVCLGYAEITLRNALHRELSTMAARTGSREPWYVVLWPIFDVKTRADITEARRRATLDGKPETRGRVVAELSFGFWRYLVSSKYHRTLWSAGLSRAFSHLDAPLRRVSKLLYRLNQLRNRICHHEPVFNRDLRALHRDVDQLMRWIDPQMETWKSSRCDLETILAAAPARIGP